MSEDWDGGAPDFGNGERLKEGVSVRQMNVRRILVLGLFFCSFVVSAQLRESVVIVQPNLSDEGVAMYRSIATYFRQRGLVDLADYFEGFTSGGFGSGYLASDKYGRSIVVTNRHVVTFADTVTVIMSDEDGSEVSVDGCRVIYEDDDIDFALILLRQGALADFPKLDLAESVPKDGETVWSAGYPGLFGKPSWQLSKGVVTNRRVVVEQLGSPEYAVFTQHSAPIDPGNSGGPLLVGDPSDPSSLRVVGINTWTVWGRQSSNFAISLDMLREAFKRVEEAGKAPQSIEAVRVKAEELIGSLNRSQWSRFESRKYISSRMVALQGWQVFTSLLSSLSEAEATIWIERFLAESPEETLCQAIYYQMHNNFQKEGQPVVLDSVNEVPDPTEGICIRTSLSTGRTIYYIDWIEEAAHYRILEAGIPSIGLEGPQKKRIPRELMPEEGYPFPSGLVVGSGVTSIPTIYGWRAGFNAEIGYHLVIGRIASVGVSAVIDKGASLVETGSQSTPTIFGIEGQGRIGFPILLPNMTLFPFIGSGLCAGFTTAGSASGSFRFSAEAHAGLLLRPSSKWSIGLSLGSSFATDNGLRLEGIPVRVLLMYSFGKGTVVTQEEPVSPQVPSGEKP